MFSSFNHIEKEVMKTRNISVYFDPEKHGDLKVYISKLASDPSTPYYDRSESEIARMLLQEKLKEVGATKEKKK